ncbi:hypothetical protein [Microvirga sp. P5_D2]
MALLLQGNFPGLPSVRAAPSDPEAAVSSTMIVGLFLPRVEAVSKRGIW